MKDRIAKRIATKLEGADLTELLTYRLSGSDLHSLLLPVLKERISKIDAPALAAASAVTRACDLDARLLSSLERTAYEVAAGFEAIELSPVSPLGAVSVLTGLDQANVLSTVRALECASDPTIGLALESARRRKVPNERNHVTRLCTNQRVVRYPLPQNPAFTAHFKLFTMVTAGRDTGSFSFELSALKDHIGIYLDLLSQLMLEGFTFQDIVVELSDTRAVADLCSMFNIDRDEIRASVRARDASSAKKILERYADLWPQSITNPGLELAPYNLPRHLIIHLTSITQDVVKPLSEKHKTTKFNFNMHRLTGLGYYTGPCFHIKVTTKGGQTFALADGGFVSWTQRLLGDRKERLLTSAIGTELICRLFR